MSDKELKEFTKKLNSSQKKFILNASVKPKPWMAIRRHAKITHGRYVHFLIAPFGLLTESPDGKYRYFLTPKGVAVKNIIKQLS